MDISKLEVWLRRLDDLVWGPVLLVFLLGTGVLLMVGMDFLPLRNLGWALKCAFGLEKKNLRTDRNRGNQDRNPNGIGNRNPDRNANRNPNRNRDRTTKEGGISPFSALMTELAATIGTGNIVGVATAMVLGGPGALVWMVLSSFVGLATRLAESTLSVKYRTRNRRGEIVGGPMYTMVKAFPYPGIGKGLGIAFSLFAVLASFGMGNMTQSNSIASVLEETFQTDKMLTGLVISILTILVVLGGIGTISRVTSVLVPAMAVCYLLGALAVIATHWRMLPEGLEMIFVMAFSPRAMAGGVGGMLTGDLQRALRWGVSRGVFSNEAGLGAAGISAASASTSDPVRQGYISMTGVFLDTAVICTVTGLALACSGILGSTGADGVLLTGAQLTVAAFSSTFGEWGAVLVSSGIVLFAFATMIGWAYQGEKAFEFLTGNPRSCIVYRFLYGLAAFPGAVCALDLVWDFADICNGLMAIPNLICLLGLSGEVCGLIKKYGKKGSRPELPAGKMGKTVTQKYLKRK